MSKQNQTISALIVMAITLAIAINTASAQTDTVFTYQGLLTENGSPVTAPCDLRFRLFDSASGGSQIGISQTMTNVPITDGRFTVQLDFGLNAFDNSRRWLDILYRCPAGTGPYLILIPRQPITRSPYAIQTRGIVVDADENVGIGTATPLDELHVAGDNATLRLEDTTTPGGFTLIEDPQPTQMRFSKTNPSGQVLFDMSPIPADGTSNALVRFFRSTDTDGIKRVQFLRGNLTTSPSASIGVDGEDSYFQIHGGNLGIGTTDPNYPLHAETDTEFTAIFAHNTDPTGVTSGVLAYADSDEGIGVYGSALATSSVNNGVFGRTNSNIGRGVFGLAAGVGGINFGVYGASDSNSGYDFYAAGAGINYGAESSQRWKNNVEPISEPLAKLAQIRGVYFDWDQDHGGQHDVGMIAEEVGKILPEIVNYEENGIDANGMDYSKLTPLLVEAMKALRDEKDAEIKLLRDGNAALHARLASLETIVEQLVSTEKEQAK